MYKTPLDIFQNIFSWNINFHNNYKSDIIQYKSRGQVNSVMVVVVNKNAYLIYCKHYLRSVAGRYDRRACWLWAK